VAFCRARIAWVSSVSGLAPAAPSEAALAPLFFRERSSTNTKAAPARSSRPHSTSIPVVALGASGRGCAAGAMGIPASSRSRPYMGRTAALNESLRVASKPTRPFTVASAVASSSRRDSSRRSDTEMRCRRGSLRTRWVVVEP
jgi:hypothetical protein